MDFGALLNPRVNAISVGSATSEDRGARRAAHGAGRVALGEADALFCEGVEVRRLDDRVALHAEIAPAEIVGEEDDEVG